MDWNDLKHFYVIAGSRNLSDAAEKLGMHPSNMSRVVKKLEKELSNKLIEKKHSTIILTSEGNELFNKIEPFFIQIEKLKSLSSSRIDSPIFENLRVATTPGIMEFYLSDYIPDFMNKHENYKLIVRTFSSGLETKLKEVDAIIAPKIGNRDDLKQVYISTFNFSYYSSLGYLEKNGYPTSPSDVIKHQLISFSTSQDNPFSKVNALSQERLESISIEVDSPLAEAKLVSAGLGVSMLEESVISLFGKSLIKVFDDAPPKQVKCYLIYPKENHEVRKISDLRNFLKTKRKDI